ncbi:MULTISPECIES: (2Fe-2S)-binding protein [Pseudonocardia]|uniref:Carbon monoxide dehydrogenase small chain n=2 Tax=Pseudonocardia TaxID=1847 RepID=A0A1Y2N6Y2_PSEAH|nr:MULTISPECIES: (2Fe-2S)-binding protein [Pseudonocardia]OSY43224.1 Carbon monoxide dehydrogenase small chain [Pseudonocardia autotrophica]TDN71712.1 carbon-monoxide dehydrogenase small subunit [Pseudonocardia autotrophica]BBG02399.1 (2Fe-2S)-binding protein [Pseudonocardia autotrophica]GEC23265.1 (2Fe-2S)-binding protein [Pseudonocardia saturnea]
MTTTDLPPTAPHRPTGERVLTMQVNGEPVAALAEPRTNLADFLRERAGRTGTHTSCHQGWCGACTVLVDGESARACLTLAVQADRAEVTTVEGVEDPDGTLSHFQQALIEHTGFQCGFCTPGFVVLGTEIIAEARAGARFDRDELIRRLSANICRCTGYAGIVTALESALESLESLEPARQSAPRHGGGEAGA